MLSVLVSKIGWDMTVIMRMSDDMNNYVRDLFTKFVDWQVWVFYYN